MSFHWHHSIENVLWVGIVSLLFLNLWRLVAAWLVQRGGIAGEIGSAMGALVHFGG